MQIVKNNSVACKGKLFMFKKMYKENREGKDIWVQVGSKKTTLVLNEGNQRLKYENWYVANDVQVLLK